jgi:hypothetical protein
MNQIRTNRIRKLTPLFTTGIPFTPLFLFPLCIGKSFPPVKRDLIESNICYFQLKKKQRKSKTRNISFRPENNVNLSILKTIIIFT